jgi:hypothetical protein
MLGVMQARAAMKAMVAAAEASYQQALAYERRQAPKGEVYPGVWSISEVFKAQGRRWKPALIEAHEAGYAIRFMERVIPIRHAFRWEIVDVYAFVDEGTMNVTFHPVREREGVKAGGTTVGGERETTGASIGLHRSTVPDPGTATQAAGDGE